MLRTAQRYRNLLTNMFSFMLKLEPENIGLARTWAWGLGVLGMMHVGLHVRSIYRVS
jgi:hypothetical protein